MIVQILSILRLWEYCCWWVNHKPQMICRNPVSASKVHHIRNVVSTHYLFSVTHMPSSPVCPAVCQSSSGTHPFLHLPIAPSISPISLTCVIVSHTCAYISWCVHHVHVAKILIHLKTTILHSFTLFDGNPTFDPVTFPVAIISLMIKSKD